MSDGFSHDVLLIIATVLFISFILGKGGGQEQQGGEEGQENQGENAAGSNSANVLPLPIF